MFITRSNLENLKKCSYWIKDGTFKTVTTLFRQVYTIHALVGTGKNPKKLPLVYKACIKAMASKSEECCIRLFESLNDFAAENELDFNLQFILTDFEQAAINSSKPEKIIIIMLVGQI